MAKTIKELNVVINDLHKKFEDELQDFRKSLKEATSPDPFAKNTMLDSLMKKVSDFENQIMQQLGQIQVAIERLEERDDKIEKYVDREEQKAYRNYLLVHGVEEADNETREKLFTAIKKILIDKLNIEVKSEYLSDCYRIGRKPADNNKGRPVVVLFTIRWLRDEVFANKSKFKGSKFMCTEMLTKRRLDMFKKCALVYKKQCWTMNGNLVVLRNGRKNIVTTEKQLNDLIGIANTM